MNIKSFENSGKASSSLEGHFKIFLYKLWFSIVFLTCVEEKRSRCNTGEQFRFILIFSLLLKA